MKESYNNQDETIITLVIPVMPKQSVAWRRDPDRVITSYIDRTKGTTKIINLIYL